MTSWQNCRRSFDYLNLLNIIMNVPLKSRRFMKKTYGLLIVTCCFLAFFMGCKEDEGAASEIGKPSISFTAPGLTIADNVVNITVAKDSVIAIDYEISAPGGVQLRTQTLNGEAIQASGTDENKGRFTVNVPFDDVTMTLHMEVTDEQGQTASESISIVVKTIVLVPGINLMTFVGTGAQGETVTIKGTGFSEVTDATLFFTDFEEGSLNTPVVGDLAWLKGASQNVPENYRYSDVLPLSGTRIARSDANQSNIGELYADLPDMEECFVEFFTRYHLSDYESTGGGGAQIKHSRLSSGSGHTDVPMFGITIQGGPNPTLVFQNDPEIASAVRWSSASLVDDAWARSTIYMKLSTPGVADGMQFYRTSWTNQWSYSGTNYMITPDAWGEPASITRGSGVANSTLQRCFFPFYQRSDQSTVVDLNHIYIHNSLERVYLSTSPTATASNDFQHVVCPTISRSSRQIQFTSMIDCLPPEAAVYLYVVNADNEVNEDGFLIREAL